MQNQYSPALIEKMQKLVLKRTGVKISKSQAVLYLDRLSRLMLTVADIANREKIIINKKYE